MTEPLIDSAAVEAAFRDCLFRDNESVEGHVRAQGVLHDVGFHAGRLEEHRAEIVGWLTALPAGFQEETGGGWSFLNACQDRNDVQWTGMHQRMEQLVQLGVAIGRVRYNLPREYWESLPGGMPYFTVTKE